MLGETTMQKFYLLSKICFYWINEENNHKYISNIKTIYTLDLENNYQLPDI